MTDWETQAKIDFIADKYRAGYTKEWIGKQLTPRVSKSQVDRALTRHGISRDRRLPVKDIVMQTRVTDLWQAGKAAPAWLTPEADELFVTMWKSGISGAAIDAFFDITDEQRRRTRARLGLNPRDDNGKRPRQSWRTEANDAEFRLRYERGDQELPIRQHFNIGKTSYQTWRADLGLEKRVKPDVIARRMEQQAAIIKAKAAAPKAAPEPVPKPKVDRPITQASGARQTAWITGVINWTAVRAMKVEHRPGVCQWALECSEPAQGRFCDHHSGLLKATAA